MTTKTKILLGIGGIVIVGLVFAPKLLKNKNLALFPMPDRPMPKTFTNCKKWWFQGNACGCADTIGGGQGYGGPRIFNSIDECIVQNNVSTENQIKFQKELVDYGY